MATRLPQVGIAAIAIHEPTCLLANDWFGDLLPSKFVRHTGIESRRISDDDEVAMALRAVENLRRQTPICLADCVGVVFTASSLMPDFVRQKYLEAGGQQKEALEPAARRFLRCCGLESCRLAAINWGCSGFSKAMTLARDTLLPSVELGRDQFLLLVTVNRTSSILDFSCKQTAGLFGDFAQATVLARTDSDRYPVHFEVLGAIAETCPVDGVFFDYHLGENVPVPTSDGGRDCQARRLVFSLNGMGIADAAPRVMADAAEKALRQARIDPKTVNYVVPHQAGSGIVRLAAMQMERFGIGGEIVNGLTREVANISSSSVPYAIRHEWNRLDGIVVCPTAGVGDPGDATVTCGCVILRATEHHRASVRRERSGGLDAVPATANPIHRRIDHGTPGLAGMSLGLQSWLNTPGTLAQGGGDPSATR